MVPNMWFHPRVPTVSPGGFCRRKYVLVEMGLGQWLLVGAEVIHYFLYYTVKGGTQRPEKARTTWVKSGFGMPKWVWKWMKRHSIWVEKVLPSNWVVFPWSFIYQSNSSAHRGEPARQASLKSRKRLTWATQSRAMRFRLKYVLGMIDECMIVLLYILYSYTVHTIVYIYSYYIYIYSYYYIYKIILVHLQSW